MIKWGIVGAGRIARVFCNALLFSESGQLQAIASRSKTKADTLANLFGCATRYGTYDELFRDKEVDAVYVATIHPAHLELVLRALAAGKHVLVEKPIAMNAEDSIRMIEAAKNSKRFLMEGFMYRCHPQMDRIVELIAEGTLGTIGMIRSEFGSVQPFDPHSRVYNRAMGGGAILDVGCYTVSIVRRIAGAAAGRLFLDPLELRATGVLGPTGVDHRTAAVLQFENGIIAEIATAVDCVIPAITVIHGSEGILTVPNPWLPSCVCRGAESPLPLDTQFPGSVLMLQKPDGTNVEFTVAVDRDLFSYEADTVARFIQQGQAPAMSWDDTIGNMRTIDRWLTEIGYHSILT